METFSEQQSSAQEIEFDFIAENALLITWPEMISPAIHQQISALEKAIKQHFHQKIIETIISYNSLIIYYDFTHILNQQLADTVVELLSKLSESSTPSSNHLIEIPVYYGPDAGLDLPLISQQTHLTLDEIIHLHTARTYQAYALGFTPGFCYLASLDKALCIPRLASPRTKVPSGSVAIAEHQTAVYPNESPGGWHIIGKTPIAMFTQDNKSFSAKINVGDQVKFTAIDKARFIDLGGVI